jgi:hypothetical protein
VTNSYVFRGNPEQVRASSVQKFGCWNHSILRTVSPINTKLHMLYSAWRLTITSQFSSSHEHSHGKIMYMVWSLRVKVHIWNGPSKIEHPLVSTTQFSKQWIWREGPEEGPPESLDFTLVNEEWCLLGCYAVWLL